MFCCSFARADLADAPYPPSTLITGVTWDWSSLIELAPGSDNWPITWSDDDHQYTFWGDGGAFGGTNGNCRASLGVARIEGDWTAYAADPLAHSFNVWGCNGASSVCLGPVVSTCAAEHPADFGGKSYGIISVAGILYAWWGPGSGNAFNADTRVLRSTDHAQSWEMSDWNFERGDDIYGGSFLNFGQDNTGARRWVCV